MRVRLRTLLGTLTAAGLLLGGAAVATAPAQQASLSLEFTSFQLLRQDTPDAEPTKAYVVRQGERYQFRVHYKVAGADAIRTGHTFSFVHIPTGRQVDVDSRSFDPEPPGSYNEYSARRIPASWPAGAYRLVWNLRASAVDAQSAREEGAVAFLVVPAGG